jgi:hypothetical protein
VPHITVPESVSWMLLKAGGPVEVRDEAGRVLGRFLPPAPTDFDRSVPELPPGELERRRQSKEWYTTEEVLKRLHTPGH